MIFQKLKQKQQESRINKIISLINENDEDKQNVFLFKTCGFLSMSSSNFFIQPNNSGEYDFVFFFCQSFEMKTEKIRLSRKSKEELRVFLSRVLSLTKDWKEVYINRNIMDGGGCYFSLSNKTCNCTNEYPSNYSKFSKLIEEYFCGNDSFDCYDFLIETNKVGHLKVKVFL